jgi:Kef-type K+ transport system membrane component KefB
MPLLTSLLILIVVARLFGQIFERFNQPAIVGEMVAGVLLGPSVLNLIHANAALSGISELAVFLVVLSAGLEMNFKDIVEAFRGRGLVIAGLGFAIPLIAGILVAAAFQSDVMRTVFLASRYHELDRTLRSVTEGFLAPVFFASLGLEFNLGAMKSFGFVAIVLAVSIGSKILAGWLGGRLIQLSPARSLGIGIILNGRGVMELVIASIAYERGFIGQGLFSTLVLMGVVTTMITPLMLRKWVMPKLDEK